MKKIAVFYTLIFFLFLFLLLNYRFFVAHYYSFLGNKAYKSQNYYDALEYHRSAFEYLNQEGLLYNMGNDYFRIGAGQDDVKQKIGYYKKSLEMYETLLKKESFKGELREKAKQNYDIVKSMLADLESSLSKSKEPETSEEQNSKQDPGDSKNNISDHKQNSGDSEMLSSEQKDLQRYIQRLKKEGEENIQFFNNHHSGSLNHNFMDMFFDSDPFLNNLFDRGGEKDW